MPFIGNHIKLNLPHRERERARRFYGEVLGCRALNSPLPELDVFEFESAGPGSGFVVRLFFLDDIEVLSEQDQLRSAWLEIKVADPDELKRRLLAFGVREVDYLDPLRFYFQSPGGQVFRVAPLDGGL